MRTIEVTVRSVYGRDMIYPVCQQAKILCQLLKQETFTMRDIALLEQLGYEITQKQEEKKL